MTSPLGPFIDGEAVESRGAAVVETINPTTGRPSAVLAAGCAQDVDRAVASSRAAFEDGRWSEAPPSRRKSILHRLADAIAAEAPALDRLDAEDMGKPIGLAMGSAASAAGLMRFHAEAVDKIAGECLQGDHGSLVVQRRAPRGVVAAVTPWNFPVTNVVRKVAPALAAGNTVVLKPSELSSRSAFRIARLALEAGVPPGVLNLVPGAGAIVGEALGLHPDVDMMTFTGSTAVGKLMLQYAGRSNMKQVLAECGGKSPQLVFDDAVDLEAAGEAIARGVISNQGQVCSMGSRVLVQRSAQERLLAVVADRLAGVRMGDPCDPATTFGPLASRAQYERVSAYARGALDDGARLLGEPIPDDAGGCFMPPAVFQGVDPEARIAREEIFGPVLAVIPFDDEAEAIRIANATLYGLVAYLWTADLSRGLRVGKSIRSSVFINAARPRGEGAGHGAAFEPVGESGLGPEGGLVGMESYLRRQTLWINHA